MASTSKDTGKKIVKIKGMKALVDQFTAITGADKEVAVRMLEACDGNLEVAINMHVDSGELGSGVPQSDDKPTFSNSDESEDNVRAPIPPTSGILVEGVRYSFRGKRKAPKSVFDGFRNFKVETKRQEDELWNASNAGNKNNNHKLKTLEDLFRPPLDLMFKGTFVSARDACQSSSKWLLVNIQNVQEFSCQILNRDLWSNQNVRSLVNEHFIFWQVYNDSEEGERYMQFYKVLEWPYIAVVDPQTGENLVVWHVSDPVTFCDLVNQFLGRHVQCWGSELALPAPKRQKREELADATEEEQLLAAIQASIKETKEYSSDSSDSPLSQQSLSPSPEPSQQQSPSVSKPTSPLETSATESQSMSQLKEDTSPEENSCTTDIQEPKTDEWKDHLGSESDVKSELLFRFPDGKKEQLTVPASSKLFALESFVKSKGFSNEQYELVTNFPRRRLSSLDMNMTLKDAGLYPQETIFVQAR